MERVWGHGCCLECPRRVVERRVPEWRQEARLVSSNRPDVNWVVSNKRADVRMVRQFPRQVVARRVLHETRRQEAILP